MWNLMGFRRIQKERKCTGPLSLGFQRTSPCHLQGSRSAKRRERKSCTFRLGLWVDHRWSPCSHLWNFITLTLELAPFGPTQARQTPAATGGLIRLSHRDSSQTISSPGELGFLFGSYWFAFYVCYSLIFLFFSLLNPNRSNVWWYRVWEGCKWLPYWLRI